MDAHLSGEELIEFAPLGPVLTVIGIGVAERTGFISGATGLGHCDPSTMLTATVVFAGVMSSMAADAGHVVLTPLGALLFTRSSAIRSLVAYAGVSGGFSANR